MLGQYRPDGTPLRQYLWLDAQPVGVIVNSQPHYVQPDHLGTPRAVIEPARNVAVWTWDLASEAFGNSPPATDPDGDGTDFVFDLRFPGQRYDAASGLNYNYVRDYEPATGRYVESDPVGHLGGINTYAYAANSPLAWLDPDGLQAVIGPYPGYYPPGTSPTPGARPLPWPTAGGFAGCLNPIAAGIILMTVPGNIGQDASCSDDPLRAAAGMPRRRR